MRAHMPRVGLAVGVIFAAVVVGAGAYAFGPASDEVAAGPGTSAAPADASGAGASSAPASPEVTDTVVASTPSNAAPSPSKSPAKSPSKAPSKAPAGCAQGEKHQEVEVLLARIGSYGAVSVDGRQSDTDCATIRKFQARFGVSPANGRAGPTTVDVARRIAQSLTAAEQARCGAGGGLTACVDLTQQTMWVVRDGTVVFGPTVIRTGMKGYATPAGTYRINYRNIKEWSNPYEVWLPYWQHFVDGIGFHETTTYLHNMPNGSHGCVNLLRADAAKLWTTIGHGTTVKTFGRRSGT